MFQKNKLKHLYLFFFISLFFLWDLSIKNILKPYFDLLIDTDISFKYLILFLIFPILFKKFKLNKSIYKLQIFNNQKYILYFIFFVIIHFFFTKYIYQEKIELYEISKLFFLILISFIYSNYRNYLFRNFEKIIYIYLVLFIFFSLTNNSYIYNVGACNNNFFLIHFIAEKFNFNFSNSFYKENSHLAMMMVSVTFVQLYILQKNKTFIYSNLFLLLLSNLIIFLNYSTTFSICYLICQIIIFLFFFNKLSITFWFLTLAILSLNTIIFFSDENCKRKVTDYSINNVKNLKIEKTTQENSSKNLTTLIYERSSVLTIYTFKKNQLGWGFDGMNNATLKLLEKNNYKEVYWPSNTLNLNDGLSNFFKILNEFGIFSIIVLYLFLKYLISQKKLNSFNLFIITLFITLCIRGAGYFNGGFIFCFLEFLYIKRIIKLK